MALIALLFRLINVPSVPEAQVETPASEMEAFYVPPGVSGPIVAAPFNVDVF